MAFENLLVFGTLAFVLLSWIGLSVGSFLNVVIYRLPLMLERSWTRIAEEHLAEVGRQPQRQPDPEKPFNLTVPRSHCPHCGTPIKAWQNIPVLSWLLLRGRCADCGASIAIRYPAVELLTAVATLAVIATFSYTGFGYAALFFTWTLIAATFIDLDTQLLPDQLTLPLLWAGLIVNGGVFAGLQGPVGPTDAIIGTAAGYLSLWSLYWSFKLMTGKEGMGYGDFKLLGAIGAWLGWQVLPATILIASLTGLTYALLGMLRQRQQFGQPMPFGPFLAIGGWVCLIDRARVLAFFSL